MPMMDTEPLAQLFDLSAVLRTNDSLSDAAHDEAKAHLLNAEKEMKRLDLAIAAHSSKKLQNDRVKIAQRVQSYRIIIAPHRRLPPEILSEIFRYCVAPEIRVGSKPFTGPLDLVCSRWRRIALGTPGLWNEIHIDYGDWSDYRILTKEAKLRLSRSGYAPLSLTISGVRTSKSFNAVSDLVIPHAGHLASLSVKSSTKSLMEFLLLPPASVAHLKSVELCFLDDSPIPPNSLTWIASQNLRTVSLTAPRHYASISFPWRQLTCLCLHTSITPTAAVVILQQCFNLKQCSLFLGASWTGRPFGPSETEAPVVLAALEFLWVHLSKTDSVPYRHLLQPLILPKLDTFCLLASSRYMWYTPLKSVLKLSSSFVKLHLSVQVASFDIEEILHDMPLLADLSLRVGQPFARSTLDIISRGGLVPKLEHLECITTSLASFLDMVECRQKSDPLCSTLKTVSVYANDNGYTRDCRSRVTKLIAGGMEIVFFRHPW